MALPASDRDLSADPGVDFYRYANGGWLDANPIPAGYGAWGAFEEVSRRNEVVLKELLETAASAPGDGLDGLLGAAYAAGMDLDAIEAAGTGAIAELLAAAEREDLAALHRAGIFVLFGWGVTADHDDTDRNLLWLSQDGLGLPDRESYFEESAAELRGAYVEHIDAQLRNAGVDGDGAAILAFETRLAELHWRAEERRDTDRIHNRFERGAIAPLLGDYLDRLGATPAETVTSRTRS